MYEHDLEKYWKTVVNTVEDGIMILDKEGIIVSINDAISKITGYSRKELVGEPCSVLNCDICEQAREDSGRHWCVLFKTGRMDRKRCKFIKKDGSTVYALKNASLLLDHQNQVIGAVESVTDISEIIAKDYQIEAFKRELKDENGFHGLIGNSPAMQKIYSLINNAAQSDAPVVILGESGTGKELVAKCIHDLDPNPKRPFVKVNCAALTESLLESELFGHVKGAYTGAFKNRQGRFELANGGDIFLDEIGDIPLSIQIKLLRVLDEKIIERVGDSTPLPIKVRIISATNRNLVELVGKGMFRDDLYFRINVVPIAIPPLRERPEDISLLADAFIERIRLKTGKPIHYISKNALEALRHYSWPGNVRELKGALEYAFVTCHEPIMRLLHLPMHIAKAAPPKPASLQKSKQPKKRVLPLNSNNQSLSNRHRAEFIKALDQANGNQSLAAEILGISRVTVWHRMKKYNISFDRRLEVRPPDMNQQES